MVKGMSHVAHMPPRSASKWNIVMQFRTCFSCAFRCTVNFVCLRRVRHAARVKSLPNWCVPSMTEFIYELLHVAPSLTPARPSSVGDSMVHIRKLRVGGVRDQAVHLQNK